MSDVVLLATAISHDDRSGRAGLGWVAVAGDRVTYGSGFDEAVARPADAEPAAALAGLRGALDAFPGARRVLHATDGHEVLHVPWGDLSDGMDPALDATGIVAECRARGVSYSVRWWPGHRMGPEAPDVLLAAARALAVEARRGGASSGSVAYGPGWRSRLVAAIGPDAMDRGPRSSGLPRDRACALMGIRDEDLSRLLAHGRLRRSRHRLVTLSSALETRDQLEREGLVEWPADDLGAAHLRVAALPSSGTLCLGTYVLGRAHGVGVARGDERGWTLASERSPCPPDVDPQRAAREAALSILSWNLDLVPPGLALDVIVTDPLIAIMLASPGVPGQDPTGDVRAFGDKAAARGIAVRPRLVREDLARARSGDARLLAMLAAIDAAKVAAASAPLSVATDAGPGHLASLAGTAVRTLSDAMAREAQARLIDALFEQAPREMEARRRFEALASATHATYRGRGLVRMPFLPGPVDGGVGVARRGGPRPCSEAHGMGPDLVASWEGWWAEHASLVARNPAYGLREALLRLDPDLEPASGPTPLPEDLWDWVSGQSDARPPWVREDHGEGLRDGLRALATACGGWPFGRAGAAPAKAA